MDAQEKTLKAVPAAESHRDSPNQQLQNLHTRVGQRDDWSPAIHLRPQTQFPKRAHATQAAGSYTQPDKSQRCSKSNCDTGSTRSPASSVPAEVVGPALKAALPEPATHWPAPAIHS